MMIIVMMMVMMMIVMMIIVMMIIVMTMIHYHEISKRLSKRCMHLLLYMRH